MLRVSPPPSQIRGMIKTGTYVGDGLDNRNVNIGVDLASMPHKFVMIKQTGAQIARWRPSALSGDNSLSFENTAIGPDRIQSFTSTGFQLGTHGDVNADGITYYYVVVWESR